MPSQVDFFVSMALGVAPALALLWLSLRRFDRPKVDFTLFADRRVFGSLAAGAASTAAAATIYWSAKQILTVPEFLATFAIFSVSLSLVNVDTGALIGFGAAQGDLWRALGRAVAVRY